MITETDIRKLTDYVLLNAYSVDSTGFYNGKAGLSLCLFEVARMINDECVEDHAFELLQEALLSRNEDIGFENGLSGIGYVFLYLINNHFINADINDFFSEKRIMIDESLRLSLSDDKRNQRSLVLYFILSLQRYMNDEERKILSLFIDKTLDMFQSLFLSVEDKNSKLIKIALENEFLFFLKFMNYANSIQGLCTYNYDKELNLYKQYANLFQKDAFMCNYQIGYYLGLCSEQFNNEAILTVSLLHKQRTFANLNCSVLTLKQKIDLLFILCKDYPLNEKHIIEIENSIFFLSTKNVEQSILENLNPKDLNFTCQDGIARLLLYIVYKNEILLDKENVNRFDNIFI